MFGLASIFIDFFFVTAGPKPGEMQGPESPVSSGVDIGMRLRAAQIARKRPPMGL